MILKEFLEIVLLTLGAKKGTAYIGKNKVMKEKLLQYHPQGSRSIVKQIGKWNPPKIS